ncbi:MAG TPA: hypothetical protein VMB82_07625 [Acidimicrobiales bacterium]|nr:hypothetical protein [Acidimicrobiales bacterium]
MAAFGHSDEKSGGETGGAPRHAAKPAAVPGRRALHFDGASFLEEGSAGSGSAGPDAALDFDAEGIRLSRQDGDLLWSTPWSDVSMLAVTDEGRLPDGSRGLVVVVTTADDGDRQIAVASHRPGAAGARIRATARRRLVDPDRPDRRVPLPIVLGVVAVSGALVVWLLLLAGHVVAR